MIALLASLSLLSPAHAKDGISISAPRPENAIGFCYLSGSVRPTNNFGQTEAPRAVRLRFDGIRTPSECLETVRDHCRSAYLDRRAKIEKLRAYYFFFLDPDKRWDYTLSSTDCSAESAGPPKIVTH